MASGPRFDGIAEHDAELLSGYAMGGLEDDEARSVEEHLAGCERCRAELDELMRLRGLLDLVPGDAFGDPPRRRAGLVRLGIGAAAVVLLGLVAGGGVLIGRAVAGPAAPATVAPAGSAVASGTGPGGVRLTVAVIPAAGWVRLNVSAAGIRAGERCRLFVVSRAGERTLAASWLVPPEAERNGVILDGSALVAPADVAEVEIQDGTGRTLVSAQV